MYYALWFMQGEWVLIDFTPGAGSRLCIATVLFGMMVFNLPMGIISQAVEDTLYNEFHKEDDDEDKPEWLQQAMTDQMDKIPKGKFWRAWKCAGCGETNETKEPTPEFVWR